MGVIQSSINQGIGTVGTMIGLGKHVKEQKVANELAKQREATDILNQLPQLETEATDLKDQIGQQEDKYKKLIMGKESAQIVGRQDLVKAAAPEIEKQEESLRILFAKQGAMAKQRERLEERLKNISGTDYADIREKSQAIFTKGREDIHKTITEIVDKKFPDRGINETLDKLIGDKK